MTQQYAPGGTSGEEIAVLKARIRDLEGALRLADTGLEGTFKLTPTQTSILGLLMTLPHVAPEVIRHRLEVAADTKVAMFRLRKALKPWDIKIYSKRSIGYWLDFETKARIEDMVTSKVTERKR